MDNWRSSHPVSQWACLRLRSVSTILSSTSPLVYIKTYFQPYKVILKRLPILGCWSCFLPGVAKFPASILSFSTDTAFSTSPWCIGLNFTWLINVSAKINQNWYRKYVHIICSIWVIEIVNLILNLSSTWLHGNFDILSDLKGRWIGGWGTHRHTQNRDDSLKSPSNLPEKETL